MQLCDRSRRHFTEAAREAAALARRRKREERERNPDDHVLMMVVVRDAGTAGFGWQIRRFGHVEPAARNAVIYRDAAEAARFGQAALDAMKELAPRG